VTDFEYKNTTDWKWESNTDWEWVRVATGKVTPVFTVKEPTPTFMVKSP